MNRERNLFRLGDIKVAIANIREVLAGKSVAHLQDNLIDRMASERLFEILSEASRHVPAEWKATFGADIPWQRVADLGNRLRHAYHRVDLEILWSIYKDELAPLEAAVDAMIDKYGPIP